jgi:hypothetical protein
LAFPPIDSPLAAVARGSCRKGNDKSEAPKLTVEIQNQSPVELVDLTRGLLALADEYKRISAKASPEDDVKLYVQSMRTGSIIADLISTVPTRSPFFRKCQSYSSVH